MIASAVSAIAPEEARLAARETLYRLAAALFGYPLAETQQALEDGRLHAALSSAWQTLTGEPWPRLAPSASLADLEVGYMATFVHGRRGAPRVPLVASAYADLVAGQTPGNYLLNVQAFYRHFGLTAAGGDEGHADEPDHLVAMLEFCALLCHLERQALGSGGDPSPSRRAQRDFLARYLGPLLHAVRLCFVEAGDHGLDATLAQLTEALPDWADDQQAALAAQVGPCPPPRSESGQAEAETRPLWD
ncbi:molecular chaperone TorD family protein [Halomonas icarae]|uniref:Protein DdhD n=1 Tax=Halomonas icarae TaxID=2691040 RepID=A0A7X4VXR5_9GAMM|nr:molecular chaperone TorD family protein [Halomonas icarae]MDR5902010.1 molecular chaperone TorD family protein [Halomonas icarae]NAW12289.1 protein DdhD [Halomonas icarae]